MTTELTQSDVAVFIDFENVYVSVREKLDATPNFESIMDYCNDLGRVVIARAYADWYRYPRITSALYANGIEPMYVPTHYYDKDMGRTGRAIKNSVDMNLCVDAMKTLFLNQNIKKFVLATGDRDFIPLVNSIRQQGKEVYIIGIGGAASTHLGQSADEFVFYEQLVANDTPSISAQKAKPLVQIPSIAASVVLPKSEPEKEPDIYDTLVGAVHLVRERGYLSTLGSLKLVMKELMGGDFKENRYKDMNGKHFAKFKDFVIDAEKRGRVQIYTNGTVSEVFLPGEDARKLSQFAELKDEPSLPEESKPMPLAHVIRDQTPPSSLTSSASSRSRRRRKPRGQRPETPPSTVTEVLPMTANKKEHVIAEDVFSLQKTSSAADIDLANLLEQHHYAPDVYESLLEQSLSEEHKLYNEGIGKKFIEGQFFPLEGDTPFLFNVDEALTLSHMDHPYPIKDSERESAEETLTSEGAVEQAEPKEIQDLLHDQQSEIYIQCKTEETEVVQEDQQDDDDDNDDDEFLSDMAEPVEAITFNHEEWQAFRKTMTTFSKPASFAQIFDSLRNLRQQQQIVRTNEQLRHLVKQAINNGTLERSGRGKRVYYTLKHQFVEEKNHKG